MLYLLKGSAQEVFTAFGQQSFILPSPKLEEEKNTFIKDISRSPFLGTEAQAQVLYSTWSSSAAFTYYAQGNIFGGILKCLFGSMPLLKEDEDIEYYQKQYAQLAFAYVDEHNRPCAFFCNFRKDQVHEWHIGLIRNTHLTPKEREICLLSSRELNLQEPMPVKRVPWLKNPLALFSHAPLIQKLIPLISDGNDINPDLLQLNLVLRYLNVTGSRLNLWNAINFNQFDIQNVLVPNPLLDLILETKLDRERLVTIEFLANINHIDSAIKVKLLSQDTLSSKLKLILFFVLYHAHRLDLFLRLVDEAQFIQLIPKYPQDAYQVGAFCFLYLHQVPQDIVESILADVDFRRLVNDYLSQNPTPDFLKGLNYLAQLPPSSGRTLCLFFLEHAPLTRDGYQEILQAAVDSPLMPEAFFYLLRNNLLKGGIKERVKWILSPHDHLWPTINIHFFKNQAINPIPGDQSPMAIGFLRSIMQVLILLKECDIDEKNKKHQLLEMGARGNFLRLLLLYLPQVPPLEKKLLINLVFDGLENSARSIEVNHLPVALHSSAQELLQKISLGHILLKSSAEEATYRWSVTTRDLRKWQCFNILTQKIEQTFTLVEHHLQQSAYQEQGQRWQQQKIIYQRNLHRIICHALESKDDRQSILEQAKWSLKSNQQQCTDFIEPSHSLILILLIKLANFIISVLTLTLANHIKKRCTGYGQFFTYSKTSEQLCLLTRAVEEEMEAYFSPF